MINDQDLILFHYGDGLDLAQRQRIAQALISDPQLADRLHRLRAQLTQLDDLAQAPEPPPAMQQRWRTALAREARLSQSDPATGRWAWLRSPRLGHAVAAAVLLSFGIGIGQWLDGRPNPQTQAGIHAPIGAPVGTPSRRSPLLRGVQLHLRDTEQLLPQLTGADNAEQRRSLLAETRAQNRMYASAAEAQNDEQLARVLRAFDSALASLARERSDPQALAADQAQLSSELAVMQTKLAGAASKSLQEL